MKHNVRLSIDPPFLRDDAPSLPPGEEAGVAAFQPLEGGKALLYVRSDATRYEILHEFGHFVDWLKKGKPSHLYTTASEQAAYDFLRNNKTRWRSLNQKEQEHAHFYLLSKEGMPNFRKD
jgi:hypothetical protein